jgi:hypothetical protein
MYVKKCETTHIILNVTQDIILQSQYRPLQAAATHTCLQRTAAALVTWHGSRKHEQATGDLSRACGVGRKLEKIEREKASIKWS